MTKGGILPCIVGTIYLSIGAMAVAFPLGTASAIYLNEYARQGPMLRVIRFGINNLAGVPSVVFGLFGLALFVTSDENGSEYFVRCTDTWIFNVTGNYRNCGRGITRGAGYVSGGIARSWGHQMADHLPGNSSRQRCPLCLPAVFWL